MAVRVYARGSQVQQHRRRGGSGADDAGWERGWSGYKSVSAPRPMTKESGRRQSRDVGSRRPREGEDDARWARRKGGGGADKDSAEQKASQEGRGKDEGWRRRVSGFEALGLSNETARALEIEGLGRPTRYEIHHMAVAALEQQQPTWIDIFIVTCISILFQVDAYACRSRTDVPSHYLSSRADVHVYIHILVFLCVNMDVQDPGTCIRAYCGGPERGGSR